MPDWSSAIPEIEEPPSKTVLHTFYLSVRKAHIGAGRFHFLQSILFPAGLHISLHNGHVRTLRGYPLSGFQCPYPFGYGNSSSGRTCPYLSRTQLDYAHDMQERTAVERNCPESIFFRNIILQSAYTAHP